MLLLLLSLPLNNYSRSMKVLSLTEISILFEGLQVQQRFCCVIAAKCIASHVLFEPNFDLIFIFHRLLVYIFLNFLNDIDCFLYGQI